MRRGPKPGNGGAPRKAPEDLRSIRVTSSYTPTEYARVFGLGRGLEGKDAAVQRRLVLERVDTLDKPVEHVYAVRGWAGCNQCGWGQWIDRTLWLVDCVGIEMNEDVATADDTQRARCPHCAHGMMSWKLKGAGKPHDWKPEGNHHRCGCGAWDAATPGLESPRLGVCSDGR